MKFGHSFGSKRRNNPQPPTSLVPPVTVSHNPAPSTSTASLPMNPPPTGLGRPPSYTFNSHPRSTSPMAPATQQTMSHHPPPINTGYPASHPAGHPALAGQAQPPGYGGGYPQPNGMQNAPQPTLGQYGGSRPVEVEGAGRSKAQLIVGIDFVGRPPCS